MKEMIEKLKTTWTAFGGLTKEEQEFLREHKKDIHGRPIYLYSNICYRLHPDFVMPYPVKERWFFNPANMDIVSEEGLISNGFSKNGWIEISESDKRYLETKPKPVDGFEWVLKVPEYERWLSLSGQLCRENHVPNAELNGLRWTLVPVKSPFVEYDIIQDGLFYACSVSHLREKDESVMFNLSDLPAIVGFAGVQFKEQKDDCWYFVTTAMVCPSSDIAACWCEAPKDKLALMKPATPIKARFYVKGEK